MKNTYLVLAIVGTAIPLFFFVQFFTAGGTIGGFIEAGFANHPAAGLTSDLLISSFVFWIVMFRRRGKGGPAPWLFMALNLFIGLSCALPAYLWFTSRGQELEALG